MSRRRVEADGRVYWGARPDELAATCVESAAQQGLTLILRPDTPVTPMEGFPFDAYTPVLTERTTWGNIEGFFRHLGDVGCGWVNLRFSLNERGDAVVRYEAKPDGVRLPDGGIPGANGGFSGVRR